MSDRAPVPHRASSGRWRSLRVLIAPIVARKSASRGAGVAGAVAGC